MRITSFFTALSAYYTWITLYAANQQAIELYWQIGKQIIKKQEATSRGEGLIDALSSDLRHAFPETRGFSPTSLKRMRMITNR